MAIDVGGWVKNLFTKAAFRAYYAEFIGMVFFLFVSVGSVVGAMKTVSGFSAAFLKVDSPLRLLRNLCSSRTEPVGEEVFFFFFATHASV